VREADAPAALSIASTSTFISLPAREGLARVGAAAHGQLGGGHEPVCPDKPNEDSEGLVRSTVPVSTAPTRARLHLLPELGTLRRQGERDAALLGVDVDDQHGDLGTRGGGPLASRPVRLRGISLTCRSPSTPGRSSTKIPNSVERTARPRTTCRSRRRPATEPQGSPSRAFRLSEIRPFSWSTRKHLTVTRRPPHESAGRLRPRMRQLDRGTSLARAQVDERSEVRQGGDGPGQHRARGDFLPRLLGRLGGALLEQATAGEDQVAPAVAERRDPEFQDAPTYSSVA